jgi:hypothetical protein
MILVAVTILIMLVVAGMLAIEGLFGACAMCFNILFAGLVAFNFFEPIASALEPHLAGTKALGYEDSLCLIFLFWGTLGLLRVATNFIASTEVAFHPIVQRVGGAAFGLIAGYLVSGFLVAAFQTLPLEEKFLGYEPRVEETRGFRRYFPADRVWLAMMHRAGSGAFERTSETFDPDGTFTARYARYRRYGEGRDVLPYRGELDRPPTKGPKK